MVFLARQRDLARMRVRVVFDDLLHLCDKLVIEILTLSSMTTNVIAEVGCRIWNLTAHLQLVSLELKPRSAKVRALRIQAMCGRRNLEKNPTANTGVAHLNSTPLDWLAYLVDAHRSESSFDA